MTNFCRKRNWTVTRKTGYLWILHFYIQLNMYETNGSKMYIRTLNPSELFLRTRLSGSSTELPVFLCEEKKYDWYKITGWIRVSDTNEI
jgi:hypothetical protein